MVSAELSHNPYLLETEVRFNGREPQVNCAIGKFEKQPLASWVHEVPKIFHDEMNGFGFDLYFTGTDADFDGVVQAFRNAKVPDDSVRVLRKGGLQSADEKLRRVRDLASWLRENPSERLDFSTLTEEKPELAYASFPLLLLHGSDTRVQLPSVIAESLDSVDELEGSDLSNTPVIVFVTPDGSKRIATEIMWLIARDDIAMAQLFFAIHPMLNRDKVVRAISYLGILKPQVVSSPDDPAIAAYLLAHPITEYVRNSIGILSGEADRIASELAEVSEQTAMSSAAGEEKLRVCEREMATLRESDERLSRLAPPGAPREFGEAVEAFREATVKWRGRRRKVDTEAGATEAASDLERHMRQNLSNLMLSLDHATGGARMRIDSMLADAYSAAGVDGTFRPDCAFPRTKGTPELPDIKSAVFALKETVLVEQRSDFFGLFVTDEGEPEKVPVTTYHMEIWREKALGLLDSSIKDLVKSREDALEEYQQSMIKAYRDHIDMLIVERHAWKAGTLAKMTDKERALQAENDWLASFRGMLHEIERG